MANSRLKLASKVVIYLTGLAVGTHLIAPQAHAINFLELLSLLRLGPTGVMSRNSAGEIRYGTAVDVGPQVISTSYDDHKSRNRVIGNSGVDLIDGIHQESLSALLNSPRTASPNCAVDLTQPYEHTCDGAGSCTCCSEPLNSPNLMFCSVVVQ